MKNPQSLQGILSLAALLCLGAGYLNFFTPDINRFLFQRLFYIIIGVSFFLQASFIANPKIGYALYGAAIFCVIGALLPLDSQWRVIRTIGLVAGVIISLLNRPRISGN